jgi:hypothetical protein
MINLIPNRDTEGNLVIKQMISKSSMLFHPRCLDFTTSKYKSLCNKNSEMTDLGDGEMLFLDASLNFLTKGESESDDDFQSRLTSSCKFTWLYFTPGSSYGISAGHIIYKGSPQGEFDVWFEVAPHIPKSYGGSVPFMDGGLPLEMFPEQSTITIDGKSCALIDLDEVNYSHRLGVKIEHETGEQLKILSIFDIYY